MSRAPEQKRAAQIRLLHTLTHFAIARESCGSFRPCARARASLRRCAACSHPSPRRSFVLFDEFCDWAISRQLNVNGSDASDPAAPVGADGAVASQARPGSAGAAASKPPAQPVAQAPRAAPRPSSAFGARDRTPRAPSARAPPGSIGWRPGGTAPNRNVANGGNETAERLAKVADAASRAFARALPNSPAPQLSEAARRRQDALAAVDAEARRRAATSVTREQHEARAWDARNNKLCHGAVAKLAVCNAHVPSADDTPMGTPSPLALAATPGYSALTIDTHGRKGAPPARYPEVNRTETSWRCPRCAVVNRGNVITCVSCMRQRGAR